MKFLPLRLALFVIYRLSRNPLKIYLRFLHDFVFSLNRHFHFFINIYLTEKNMKKNSCHSHFAIPVFLKTLFVPIHIVPSYHSGIDRRRTIIDQADRKRRRSRWGQTSVWARPGCRTDGTVRSERGAHVAHTSARIHGYTGRPRVLVLPRPRRPHRRK